MEVHRIVTEATLDNPEDEGVLRNRQGFVVNSLGEVVFTPPKTEEVPQLIEEFLKWFNSPETEKIDPVIFAGLTHMKWSGFIHL